MSGDELQSRNSHDIAWQHTGRVPSLDGLRGIAILCVVAAHTQNTISTPNGFRLDWLAYLGVELFFVISGFLITLLLLRERELTGKVSLRHFFWRRVVRLLPAYLGLLVGIAVLQVTGRTRLSMHDWLAASTFIVNFHEHPHWRIGHLWSLSLEVQFYLLWPPIVAHCSRRQMLRVLLLTLVFAFTSRAIVLYSFPQSLVVAEMWTFTRLDSMATGSLVAILSRQENSVQLLNRTLSVWPMWFLGLAISATLSGFSTKWQILGSYSTQAICLGLLLWAAICRAPQFLNSALLKSIGAGSYSCYLWQQQFLIPGDQSWETRFPVNLVLAGLFSVMSYYALEQLAATHRRVVNAGKKRWLGPPRKLD